jgi:7-keto-8-aminopelargonate synthetase and related enzymes
MGTMQDWLVDAARVRERRGTVRHTRAAPVGLLDLASNDYLGLSRDPRLAAAASAATERFGTGARASRVVTGTLAVHADLERALCELTGHDAALAFSSGYTANLGVLTALGGPDTLLITDQHIHASLIDAARLSRSPVIAVPHGDLGTLRGALAARTQTRAIVVVESVYSVLGDAADLRTTADLCVEFDALLVVDEAHGIGVLGRGRGGVHAAGLARADHVVVTATLSKALGAQGGAVLGSALLREHLVNSSRSFIFDTGLAPSCAAAAAAACSIIAEEPERVAALHRIADLVASALGVERAAGPVQSVMVGAPDTAWRVAERAREAGVLVGCFRPPSVPDGVSRLRLTAHAVADPDEVKRAATLLRTLIGEESQGDRA